LINARKLTRKELIVSGGLRSGIDVAKGVVLGAEIGAAAAPFLHAYKSNKAVQLVQNWKKDLKVFMFSRGVKDLRSLRNLKPIITGKTMELIR